MTTDYIDLATKDNHTKYHRGVALTISLWHSYASLAADIATSYILSNIWCLLSIKSVLNEIELALIKVRFLIFLNFSSSWYVFE